MEDVKDKVKGLMKKVNTPFSSSSGKFRGQGRVLGSASPSSGPAPSPALPRPISSSAAAAVARSTPRRPAPRLSNPAPKSSTGQFDPFDASITTGKQSVNGSAPDVFECPVCAHPFVSEEEVSAHVESCLAGNVLRTLSEPSGPNTSDVEARDYLSVRVGEFVSGEPPEGSVEVVLRLLGNVVREPGNMKFRRIRMSNPKIKEAVGMARGGVELLESVGFRLGEEEGEVWATMGVPAEKQIVLIKEAVSLLERWKEGDSSLVPSGSAAESLVERKKVDRQVRVFFSVPESVAAKIDLPDSFYDLTAEEIKREVDLKKKKIAESQLLIPRSYKEKQMKSSRKRYKATVIRIQFPDGVVLQGVFKPWEPTTVLYEFVSSALKEPSLEFELLKPTVPKLGVIPRFPRSGERNPTLEEEDLVPSALVKFKAIETVSVPFTGLTDELLEASEPLTAATPVVYT